MSTFTDAPPVWVGVKRRKGLCQRNACVLHDAVLWLDCWCTLLAR